MSAIQKELVKVLDLTVPKKAADRQDFLVDVVRGVTKLADDDWNALSAEAQNWFNEAVDAKNAKAKTLPDFPDMAAEEPEEEAPRRRGAAKQEEEAPKGGTKVEVKEKDLKEGMVISLTTLRGKEDTGHVIEVVKGVLAIKRGNGEEVEYDLERVDKMYTLAAAKEDDAPKRRSAAKDDEPETPEIAVGDEVTLTTLRGKEATGEVVELTDDLVVLKQGNEEVEYARDRVKSIVPTKPAKTTKAAKEDDTPKRRGAAKDEAADEGKGKRASNDGVSVGTRIKELIIDDLDRTEDDIAKLLKKEGLEFRDNTLKLNFKDTHKFLDLLKAKKMLKA